MNLSTHKKSEVDLRVAQELKNHKDFISQTNQAIQNLNVALVNISLQHEKLTGSLRSKLKETEIKFENLEESCKNNMRTYANQYSNFDKFFLERVNEIQSNLNDISNTSISHEIFEDKMNRLADWMEKFQKNFDNLFGFVHSSISGMHGRLASEIQNVKKELTIIPPDIDPVKKEVQDMIQSFHVDCVGLIKEINLLKKASAYSEKKFENIYTLIDRLKAGK